MINLYYILSCLLIIGILIGFDMKSILIPNKFPDFVVFMVFSLSVLINGVILSNFKVDKIDKINVSNTSKTYKIYFMIFRYILNIMSLIILFLGCVFMIVVSSVVLQRGSKLNVIKGFYDYYVPSIILALLLLFWLIKNRIKPKSSFAKKKRKKLQE